MNISNQARGIILKQGDRLVAFAYPKDKNSRTQFEIKMICRGKDFKKHKHPIVLDGKEVGYYETEKEVKDKSAQDWVDEV